MKILIVLLIIAAAMSLGYGFWHQRTFSTFHLTLRDVSEPPRGGPVRNAQVFFLDDDSHPLARGKTDEKFGVVMVRHPLAGYCGTDLTPDQYQRCFWTQSEWLTTWLTKLRYVSIVVGRCRIERAPVDLRVNRDNLFTWWMPLPHVGGVPFSRYRAYLEIDSRTCTLTGQTG